MVKRRSSVRWLFFLLVLLGTIPSTTGGISPSQTTEISQSLYYEYHKLITLHDCANFYLRSFISCAHYCGFPACCSYPSRFSTEGGCCGGALGRRVASQAGRPGRGPLFLFIIKLSHEYAKPSALAMPISCYRSRAHLVLLSCCSIKWTPAAALLCTK